MIDPYAAHVMLVLKEVLGESAGLFFVRELKVLKMKPPLTQLSASERETLADVICDRLVGRCFSARKTAIYRARLRSALGLSNQAIFSRGESAKWAG